MVKQRKTFRGFCKVTCLVLLLNKARNRFKGLQNNSRRKV